VNVNNDEDLYSSFVPIIEFRVFRRHGICNTSNKIHTKIDQNHGTSVVHNASLQHFEITSESYSSKRKKKIGIPTTCFNSISDCNFRHIICSKMVSKRNGLLKRFTDFRGDNKSELRASRHHRRHSQVIYIYIYTHITVGQIDEIREPNFTHFRGQLRTMC
jgi:hypothetical protein